MCETGNYTLCSRSHTIKWVEHINIAPYHYSLDMIMCELFVCHYDAAAAPRSVTTRHTFFVHLPIFSV